MLITNSKRPPAPPPPPGIPLSDFPVGTLIQFHVNNIPTNFRIVHHGAPSSMYDVSFNDSVILMMDNIYTTMLYGPTGRGDYSDYPIQAYLDTDFYGMIDANIVNYILPVKIPYVTNSSGTGTIATGANGLLVKVCLPSANELGAPSGASYVPNDGSKFDYFDLGNTSGASSINAKRIAYFNGVATSYWTRSLAVNRSNYINMVTTIGAIDSDSRTDSIGIRPIICFSKDMLLSSTPNPDGSYSILEV